MKTCNNSFILFILILFMSPLIMTTRAQDSLYLIGTITGDSPEHRIGEPIGIGDVNGDGYYDFMITMLTGIPVRDQAVVKLYLGSPNLDLNADVIFHYPGSDTLNYLGRGYGIRDVNNDGYDDFVLSGTFGGLNFTKGKVFLFYGGQSIDTIPVAEFYQTGPNLDDFGYPVEGLDDINKDGYDDFAICSHYNWSDGKGYVYLFWGGDSISWQNSVTLSSGTMDDFFGESVANIGDINLDGFEDIAVGAPGGPTGYDAGRVFIYPGGSQISNIPDTILASDMSGDEFGRIVENAGDLNSDGNIEFCIANSDKINLFVNIDSLMTINGNDFGYGGYVNFEGNCDINGDGYKDFIVGNTNYRNNDSIMVGGAFLYFGDNIIDTTYKFNFEGENQWDEFSKSMTTGDINGDGYDEILIFAPGYPDYENPRGKLYIYSYIKPDGINDDPPGRPSQFQLSQNFPNPFNPSTNISYSIPKYGLVTLKVYNLLGEEVVTLVNEEKPAGSYEVKFDGSSLPSGVYIYRLTAGGNSAAKKFILLK